MQGLLLLEVGWVDILDAKTSMLTRQRDNCGACQGTGYVLIPTPSQPGGSAMSDPSVDGSLPAKQNVGRGQ
jgi:hypothetical protein